MNHGGTETRRTQGKRAERKFFKILTPCVREILGTITLIEHHTRLHDTTSEIVRLAAGKNGGYVMDHVKIDLKNCYGIKNLQRDFDFSETRAYALYAPNGVMKSCLAQTFQDAADGKDSEDRIFKTRKTVRKIIDEAGQDIRAPRKMTWLA